MHVETYEHAGVSVAMHSDEDAFNPRRNGDCHIVHMAAYHPNYELGDEELPRAGFDEIDCPVCEGGERVLEGPETSEGDAPICPRCEDFYMVEPTMYEWLRERKAEVASPLFLLDHSGITIRTGVWRTIADEENFRLNDVTSNNKFVGDSAGWDTSFVGFAYVTRERALELGIPGTAHVPNENPLSPNGQYVVADEQKMREAMIEQAESEVEEYDQYLRGDVYGYIVAEDTFAEGSCWGFFGWEYAKEQANEAAKHAAELIAAERIERAEMAARDIVTTGGS